MHIIQEKKDSFEKLINIIEILKEKCQWDKKQTIESLRNLTIEETYELSEAILKNDHDNIKEEVGDVLHLIFYSLIEAEEKRFDIKDVCDFLVNKLIYRHPHVFGNNTAKNEYDVMHKCEILKLKEKKNKKKTVLEGVPLGLPALIKAHRIQDKVRNVGFDWKNKNEVWDKVWEEIDEVKNEIKSGNKEKLEEEFGDLIFSVVNDARLYKIDPENALQKTNVKFIKRFNYIESKISNFQDAKQEEMEKLWEEAKTNS